MQTPEISLLVLLSMFKVILKERHYKVVRFLDRRQNSKGLSLDMKARLLFIVLTGISTLMPTQSDKRRSTVPEIQFTNARNGEDHSRFADFWSYR
jgi:hypothetical protein